MKSYLSVDRIEGQYAVCELELLDLKDCKDVDYWDRETVMVDIPIKRLGKPKEGDIFVVEHIEEEISCVLSKDEKEKLRRITLLQSLL